MDRVQLRGKKLDKDCHKAKTSTNECGITDKRVFCFGLVDKSTECLLPKCVKCGANIANATW